MIQKFNKYGILKINVFRKAEKQVITTCFEACASASIYLEVFNEYH